MAALQKHLRPTVLGPALHTFAGHALACYIIDNLLAKLKGPVHLQTVQACVRWFNWRKLEGRDSPVTVTNSVQAEMWLNIRNLLLIERPPQEGVHDAPFPAFLQEHGYFFIPHSIVQADLCRGGASCTCNDGATGGQELCSPCGRLNTTLFKDGQCEVLYVGVTKRRISIETFLHGKERALQPLKVEIARWDAKTKSVAHAVVWHAVARLGWETDPTRLGKI